MNAKKKITVVMAGTTAEMAVRLDANWIWLGDVISMERRTSVNGLRVTGDWLEFKSGGIPFRLCLGAEEAKRWEAELKRPSQASEDFGLN